MNDGQTVPFLNLPFPLALTQRVNPMPRILSIIIKIETMKRNKVN